MTLLSMGSMSSVRVRFGFGTAEGSGFGFGSGVFRPRTTRNHPANRPSNQEDGRGVRWPV
jgi:hypothetical protein